MPIRSWDSKTVRKRIDRMPHPIRRQINLNRRGWSWGLDVLLVSTTHHWPFDELATTHVLPYERQRFYAIWAVARFYRQLKNREYVRAVRTTFIDVEPEPKRRCRVALRDISSGVTFAYRLVPDEVEHCLWYAS